MNLDEAAMSFYYYSGAVETLNDAISHLENNTALQIGIGLTFVAFFLIFFLVDFTGWYSSSTTLSNYRKRYALESIGEAPTKNEVLAAHYNIDHISQKLSKARFSLPPSLTGSSTDQASLCCHNYYEDSLIASLSTYKPIDKAGYCNLVSSGSLNGGGDLPAIARWVKAESLVIKTFYDKLKT